jgi:peptide/nickel transport system permease protein
MSANPADRSFLRMALGHPAFVTGFVLSALFVILALVSFVWTPFDPTKLDIASKLKNAIACSIGLEQIISAAICFP